MSGSYDPNGKAHWLLRRLSLGAAGRDRLLREARHAGIPKAPYILASLERAGFVVRPDTEYFLTAEGRGALERLDLGETISTAPVVPNVRVFARERAA